MSSRYCTSISRGDIVLALSMSWCCFFAEMMLAQFCGHEFKDVLMK